MAGNFEVLVKPLNVRIIILMQKICRACWLNLKTIQVLPCEEYSGRSNVPHLRALLHEQISDSEGGDTSIHFPGTLRFESSAF